MLNIRENLPSQSRPINLLVADLDHRHKKVGLQSVSYGWPILFSLRCNQSNLICNFSFEEATNVKYLISYEFAHANKTLSFYFWNLIFIAKAERTLTKLVSLYTKSRSFYYPVSFVALPNITSTP